MKSAGSDSWIVLADDPEGPLAASVSRALRSAGQECALVRTVSEPEELSAALRRAAAEAAAPCRGVLLLAGRDAEAGPEEAVTRGLRPALATVQGLAAWQGRSVPKLWLITSGAQPVGEGPAEADVAHGALWGFGRVVALEHPELWGGLVDLAPEQVGSAAAADALVKELLAGDGEDQVAFRDGSRHVARVAPAPEDSRAARRTAIRPDGGYLVTGGLGGWVLWSPGGLSRREPGTWCCWAVAHRTRTLPPPSPN